MAANSQMSLFLLLILLPLTTSTSTTPTIYDVLGQLGFPPGLLPDSVTSYSTTQEEEGISFVIHLKKPCMVKKVYLVHYFDQEITGKATYHQITDVTGLKLDWQSWVKEPYDIVKVKVCGSRLVFSIDTAMGLVNIETDIAPYKESLTCKAEALAACDDRSSKLIS